MQKKTQQMDVATWFLILSKRLETAGRYSTSRNYRKTGDRFLQSQGNHRLNVSDITEETVARFNQYLETRGLSRNSVSIYNRVLRAACNRAIREGYAGDTTAEAFGHVFTGNAPTRKRALIIPELKRIAALDLSGEPAFDFSRDLFLFSFYARGMSFVDLAFLRSQQLKGDVLYYARRKTGRSLMIRLEPCMQQIIDKWNPVSRGDRVFPILFSEDTDVAFRQYLNKLDRHNLYLKEIGKRADLRFPLNSYAARHSWATIARDAGISLPIISSGLGHASERTTRIYLDQIDVTEIDRAARKVIEKMWF